MGAEMSVAIGGAAFIALLLSGLEIFAVLAVVGLIILVLSGNDVGTVWAESAWNQSNSFILTAVPMFVLMAELLGASKIGSDVFEGLRVWLNRMRGSLFVANIMAGGIFAALSGSSVANAAMLSSISYPELERRGFRRDIGLGTMLAGGALGILIPPSLAFIIYGYLTDTSVGQLFMAGVVPGIMMIILLTAFVVVKCYISKDAAPMLEGLTLKDKLKTLPGLLPALVIILAVTGTLYGGIATVTESAALGVSATLVLLAIRRELRLDILTTAVMRTLNIIGLLVMLIGSAYMLNYALAITGAVTSLGTAVVALNMPGWLFIIALVVLFIIIGMFVDVLSALILMLPILLPLLESYQFNLLWFGVIMVMLNELGLLTPPFGLNLFVVQGVTNADFKEIIKGSLPFCILFLIGIILIMVFPQIALWLPESMYK